MADLQHSVLLFARPDYIGSAVQLSRTSAYLVRGGMDTFHGSAHLCAAWWRTHTFAVGEASDSGRLGLTGGTMEYPIESLKASVISHDTLPASDYAWRRHVSMLTLDYRDDCIMNDVRQRELIEEHAASVSGSLG
jgi:hypothetical protein